MQNAYNTVMTIACCALGALLFPCLFRAVIGKTAADRVISINMIGTITIMLIMLLSIMLGEGYLLDIAIIYALLSFLAVVILVRIFIALNRRRGRRG